MLLDPMGGIVLTNDGHAILREIEVAHPAAKSMIELSRTQDEEVGDGTTTVIILGRSSSALDYTRKLTEYSWGNPCPSPSTTRTQHTSCCHNRRFQTRPSRCAGYNRRNFPSCECQRRQSHVSVDIVVNRHKIRLSMVRTYV